MKDHGKLPSLEGAESGGFLVSWLFFWPFLFVFGFVLFNSR